MSKETKRLRREDEEANTLKARTAEIKAYIIDHNLSKNHCEGSLASWKRDAETVKSWKKVNAERMVKAWTLAMNEVF